MPYERDYTVGGRTTRMMVLVWLSELRRRWLLAVTAMLMVAVPTLLYAILAVPTYTATGALQVSSHGDTVNPLLELAGGGGSSGVETEVEIIRRREFVLRVLKQLKLNVIDPLQPRRVTYDLNVAIRGQSPLAPLLKRVRDSLVIVEPAEHLLGTMALELTALDDGRVRVAIGQGPGQTYYEVGAGETISDERMTLQFSEIVMEPGDSVMLSVLSDGVLADQAKERLRVSSMGSARKSTNLVEISYTAQDRGTAQAVVEGIMQRYLDLSLTWQTLSASNASEFIAHRLEEAEARLQTHEETLRSFAEEEQAVQLDTQARVTIESAADLDAERQQVELQERVLGTVIAGFKRRTSAGSASLTSNFFDDPVLAANVAALTEAEMRHSVLRATLTDDHPQVVALAGQIQQRQKKVKQLLRSARKNLGARKRELDKKVEQAMQSLSAYPGKELQLARHMRDVEVSQRLYSFLLEKYQEAEIVKASTTTDKRIVDGASLPHRKSSPARGKLAFIGLLGGVAAAFGVVYLAHLLQRRLQTVESVKEVAPYPVYGTVPALDGTPSGAARRKKKRGERESGRLDPAAVWRDAHGPGAEAFRALAVSVSLVPAVGDRGRLIQVTSSQPGEGKSTVLSNLGVALAKGGGRVLIIDLDLRRPVQHRIWHTRRSPGYSDLVAKAGGPGLASSFIQESNVPGVDILTAGSKLPDTLGALMSSALESILAHLSAKYDYILLDSPPTFVSDSAVASKHADLVLLVARPGVVERPSIRQATESLGRLDMLKGLVLNHVERKHAEYYYGGGGYYYNRTYGSSEDEPKEQAAS
ncbi:MAG: AAA family ATPase [Nannocystaceae bacterium]|nr:AAA family ATPase [Nannocystaceae bacterium]